MAVDVGEVDGAVASLVGWVVDGVGWAGGAGLLVFIIVRSSIAVDASSTGINKGESSWAYT